MSDSKRAPDEKEHVGTGASGDDDSFLRDVARMDSRTPPISLVPGARLGPYRVVDLLGRGGMGVVYRAVDTRLSREVALKVLPGSVAGDERRRRFLREARSAAAINHPNVATIYEVGEVDDHVFLAMELVEGETLRVRIAAGALGIDEGARIAREIARGLAPAHAKGIVHRDLKPENVMLTALGDVKVLDFGLAKLRAPSGGTPDESLAHRETETREGAVMGTPAYMAPEQAMGAAVDARADVFALGIVLYEMVTGVRPALLGGGPVVEDDHLATIVRRCIASAQSDRFADASEVLGAFDARSSQPPASSRTKGASLEPRAPASAAAPTEAKRSTPASPTPDAFSDADAGLRPKRSFGLPLVALGVAVALVIVVASRLLGGRASAAPDDASAPSASPDAADDATSPVAVAAAMVERRLTAFAPENRVRALSVSHDGASYVYADNEGLWIAPVHSAGRRAIPLPKEVGDHLPDTSAFFPDDKRLLIGGFNASSSPTWIVSLEGGAPIAGRVCALFALSPDGTRLAFVRDEDLVVGAVTGGDLVHVESGLGSVKVSWSPDGTRLAIVRNRNANDVGSSVVEIINADGSARHTIDEERFTARATPVWTANDRVVYASGSFEGKTLVEATVDAAGAAIGRPRLRWKLPANVDIETVVASGARLFILRVDSQRDVYVARAGPGAEKLEAPPTRLTLSEADDTFAGWMPDGRVLFTSARDGKLTIYTQKPSSRVAEPFVDSDVQLVAMGALFDGDVIALRHASTESFVVRVAPKGGVRDLFSLGEGVTVGMGGAEACVRCTTTAPPRCVVGGNDDGATAFSSFDPVSGARSKPFIRLITGARLTFCSLSADGATLYAPTGEGEAVIDIATGTSHKLAVTPTTMQFVGPIPGSSNLLLSGMSIDEHSFGFGRMSKDGRQLHPLWVSDVLWTASPSFAPNGRDLAMTARAGDTDIWMLTPPDAK